MKAARWVWRGLVRKRSSNVTFAGWLPYAEIEIAILERNALSQRLEDEATLRRRVLAIEMERNAQRRGIAWQFTSREARHKLERLYPVKEEPSLS